jgi:hypothetical protein
MLLCLYVIILFENKWRAHFNNLSLISALFVIRKAGLRILLWSTLLFSLFLLLILKLVFYGLVH